MSKAQMFALVLLGGCVDLSLTQYSKHNSNWRVIGGEDAEDGMYPYQVSLRHQGYGLKEVNETHCKNMLVLDFDASKKLFSFAARGYHFGFHTCGGSIISNEYILTAAHCVSYEKPETYLVVVGTNTLNLGGEAYAVTEIHWHEDFSMWHGQNDVAVLKIVPPMAFSDKIRRVLVEDVDIQASEEVTLSGWGTVDLSGVVPNNLQHIKLQLVDVEYCNDQHELAVTNSQVCTSLRKGACKGDSGGPLVKVYSSNVIKQVGVVSFSRNCAAGYPDVYAKVGSYISWIKEKCNNCI